MLLLMTNSLDYLQYNVALVCCKFVLYLLCCTLTYNYNNELSESINCPYMLFNNYGRTQYKYNLIMNLLHWRVTSSEWLHLSLGLVGQL